MLDFFEPGRVIRMEVVVWWESGKPPMEFVGRSRIVTNHSRIVTSQQTL